MNWRWLYTSFHGRITRRQFWLGAIPLALIYFVLSFPLAWVMGVNLLADPTTILSAGQSPDAARAHAAMTSWVRLIMFVLSALPFAALMIKRRHDRGSAGLDVWVYFGLTALMILAGIAGLDTVFADSGNVRVVAPDFWFSLVEGAVGIFSFYLLIVLGFLGSKPGAGQ